MPAATRVPKQDLQTLSSLWDEIRDELLREKRAIDEEIRSYPTPIPRCDAQFNHLYERHARLARELDRIAAMAEQATTRADHLRLIGEFIASAPPGDAGEERFRARIKAKVSALGGATPPALRKRTGR